VKEAALRLLQEDAVFVPLSGRALHRPTGASSLRKKKWTTASSRCFAHKCVSAGRPPPQRLHPRHRQPTIRKLHEAVCSLKESPNRGRLGRVDGIREPLFLPLPYIAVYRVNEQVIEMLRIYHAAQDRP
jgi:toxin ParE1/3/4